MKQEQKFSQEKKVGKRKKKHFFVGRLRKQSNNRIDDKFIS